MKMWRKIGKKGLSTSCYDVARQDIVQKPTAKGRKLIAMKAAHAMRATGGGLFNTVATMLRRAEGARVQYAHDYVPILSESPAAMQNQARRKAVAGRYLTAQEIGAGQNGVANRVQATLNYLDGLAAKR